jgi:hypothetical protein
MFKVESHEPRSLKWWHEQHVRERLEMHPAYQRRSYIWGRWKQSHLIDSILNGFDIPKFYIANFLEMPSTELNTSKRPYAIIDGKQRFQAIFDFFDDKIALNSTFILNDDKDTKLAGLYFSDLKSRFPHLAERVQSFSPAVMDVITDVESFIEELFVRLNSGEAATGAERRNAMPGPVPAILRDLVVHPFFQHKIKFSIKRMQDFNLAAKLLLIEHSGTFVDTKARNLDDFARTAFNTTADNSSAGEGVFAFGVYGEARDRVYDVLEHLTPIFKDKDKLLTAQGHIPLYYWLAREHPESIPEMRAFLEFFTRATSENLKTMKEMPDSADPELSNYYTMGRTTNDAASLRGRYAILWKRFSRFMSRNS